MAWGVPLYTDPPNSLSANIAFDVASWECPLLSEIIAFSINSLTDWLVELLVKLAAACTCCA
jgi:hypothetical protein